MSYEEQLSAAKFRAERDQARQEVKELREKLDAIKAEREYDVKALNHRIAEMNPRLMPEGMQWPRYEGGEPVLLGSMVADACGGSSEVWAVEFCGDIVSLWSDMGIRLQILSPGESVKPSEPVRHCKSCNLLREVAMMDGSRISVCDGGNDEMEQVDPNDEACDKYEELLPEE